MKSLLAVIIAASLVEPSSAWTVVSTPSPSRSSNLLRGVVSAGPDAVWSVGTFTPDGSGYQRALTQHWNGTQWRTVAVPNFSGDHDTLTAVDAVSPGDVWTVGLTSTGVFDPALPAYPSGARPVVAHGDGVSWTVTELPGDGYLTAVDMVSARDGWAVGSTGGQALILRWNGTTWTAVPAPDLGTRPVHLTGVLGDWAVGYTGALGGPAEAVILHWDGLGWQPVRLDIDRTVQTALFSVAAVTDQDAWAVGYSWAAGKRAGFALRWNGRDWVRVPVDVPQEGTQLRSVVAVPTGVWAVGYHIVDGVDNALVMSYDGKGFVKDPPPGLPQNVAGTAITGVAATPAGELWAVGCLGGATRVLRRMT
ncbi:hypothetical protein [Actinoplanes derwentensis]|nr:hypothetical protein [Actinoplanes derwentensis]